MIAWVMVESNVAAQTAVQSADLLKLRSVSTVQLSPDATRAAYVVESNDGPGRPYGQVWIVTLADGKSVRLGSEREASETLSGHRTASRCCTRAASARKAGSFSSGPMAGTHGCWPRRRERMLRCRDRAKRLRGRRMERGLRSCPRLLGRRRRRDRRSGCHNALPIQAGRFRGADAFQRQRRYAPVLVDVASGRIEQLTDGLFY